MAISRSMYSASGNRCDQWPQLPGGSRKSIYGGSRADCYVWTASGSLAPVDVDSSRAYTGAAKCVPDLRIHTNGV